MCGPEAERQGRVQNRWFRYESLFGNCSANRSWDSRIENKLVLDEPAKGDVYQGNTKMIPASLREAKDALSASEMLKSAFGEDVVKHYCRAAEVELEEFDRVVTDWEIARGFRGVIS